MARLGKEAEFPCNECQAFVAAGERGMQEFKDGHFYLVTGRCGNPKSPLYEKPLAGALTASINAVHHRMKDITARLTCFVRISR